MSVQEVRKGFVVAVKSQVELVDDELCIAWPNKLFVPPSNSPWIGFHWVPVSKLVVTLGEGGEDELLGYVQIDINTPQDSGEEFTETMLSALESYFVSGRSVIYDSQAAVVSSCSRASGRSVDPYWRTSLTINFYARILRDALGVDGNLVPDFEEEFLESLNT